MQAPTAQAAPHGIVRALHIEPVPIEAQEISEMARVTVERVVQKRRVGCGRAIDIERVVAELLQKYRQHERAGVVVQAVAFMKVGNGIRRMLQHAGRIGQLPQMLQPKSGKLRRLFIECPHGARLGKRRRPAVPRSLKRLHVLMRDVAPDHLAPMR